MSIVDVCKLKIAVAVKRKDPLLIRRIFMSFFGVIVCSLSVGLFRMSALGTDPFQCFVEGVSKRIPIGFGNVSMGICVILLIAVFVTSRKYIGIGTFFTVFVGGYVVEFSAWVLSHVDIERTVPVRIACLALGLIIMSFAASVYICANLGVSAYDAQALILTDKGIGQFRWIRIITDLICVGIGFLCGVKPGIGTIATALFMGPFIDFINRKITLPYILGSHFK